MLTDNVVRWLLTEGYEVFVNAAPGSACDVIVQKGQYLTQVKVFAVKLKGPKPNPDFVFTWSLYLSPDEIRMGVKPLFVFHDQIGWNRDYFVNVKQTEE